MQSDGDTEKLPGHLTGFGSRSYRNYVLFALFFVYTLNFIDRNLMGVLAQPIIETFGLSDGQFGFLAGWPFAIFYAFMGLPIAMAADRYNRVVIIAICIVIWSIMTALCGVAVGFLSLMLFRIGVAIGEAGCSPPATSIISDYFPANQRATALGIYSMGVTVGAVLAFLFGGPIADVSGASFGLWLQQIGLASYFTPIDWSNVEGWRIAFVVVGAPGVIVALIVWATIKEPPRGYSDDPADIKLEKASIKETLSELKSKPSFWWMSLGASITAIVGYGLVTFLIPFLVREHSLSVRDASICFGAPIAAAGAIGTFFGGYVTDKLNQRWERAVAWVPAAGFILAIPAYLAAFYSESLTGVFLFWSLAIACHYTYLSAQYNISQMVVLPRSRATAVAILLILISIIGNGFGPQFVGSLSDYFMNMELQGSNLTSAICLAAEGLSGEQTAQCAAANATGLKQSVSVTVFWFLLASFCFLMSARSLKKDALVSLSGN